MKKLYTKSRYKNQNKSRAKRLLKRRLVSKWKRRNKNFNGQGKSKELKQEEELISKYTKITAPKHFSLIEKPEEAIKFINKLERLYLDNSSVFVNLKDITYLDYSAVTILVSVMFSFKTRNIKFNGKSGTQIITAKIIADTAPEAPTDL